MRGVVIIETAQWIHAFFQQFTTFINKIQPRKDKNYMVILFLLDTLNTYASHQTNPLTTPQGLHSASIPGILSLDIHAADTSKILTGGNDRNATVFNKDTEQVVAVLKGHTKKVTRVVYHPEEVRICIFGALI